ncbi:MAG TPA: phosphopentomutase [Gemmatimonadaceae bacterium]|nr:phosphopentomutase [Gemmatimonadaceae bacterium]
MTRRALILVLDGVGIGEAPDAEAYGDVGSDTLGNLARAVGGFDLPNLEAAGLGRIKPLQGVAAVPAPRGASGMMQPRSAGKDSTTGHWEIAGVHLARPFPTYPHGFPSEIIARFEAATGRSVIGNVVGSGTAVMDSFGPQHMRTGELIVYTSADSVFQVAAHESVVPLPELYAACEKARAMLVAPHDVSRVIARPFTGEPGAFKRTANRRDFSIAPPEETLLDALAARGIPRTGVGKVDDLFASRNIRTEHTGSNAEGIELILKWLRGDQVGLCFANLVDFDQLFGHRNDTAGFYAALRELDRALPSMLDALREDDLLFITADHGNDPTTPSTDHARECVPLLVLGPAVRPVDLGVLDTFSHLGATVADWLGISFRGRGKSFAPAAING